ncbi:hypothetical protein BT63DRAFT_456137 [Microthyrium microscopicum]|uniref:Uncharacterized protein n=1 Tax=Microthyrium microscopicum TaxID=703497 RepID=A0A6A6U8A8_9PEZI|nr:hypothetical protein BT63DRAFT_456137 [Microthyrium microscopicum]
MSGHRLGRGNVIEHQRPQDLARIDSVIRRIEENSSRSAKDQMTESNLKILRTLVSIEEDTANGVNYCVTLDEGPISKDITIESGKHEWPIPCIGTLHLKQQHDTSLYPARALQVPCDSQSSLPNTSSTQEQEVCDECGAAGEMHVHNCSQFRFDIAASEPTTFQQGFIFNGTSSYADGYSHS